MWSKLAIFQWLNIPQSPFIRHVMNNKATNAPELIGTLFIEHRRKKDTKTNKGEYIRLGRTICQSALIKVRGFYYVSLCYLKSQWNNSSNVMKLNFIHCYETH